MRLGRGASSAFRNGIPVAPAALVQNISPVSQGAATPLHLAMKLSVSPMKFANLEFAGRSAVPMRSPVLRVLLVIKLPVAVSGSMKIRPVLPALLPALAIVRRRSV